MTAPSFLLGFILATLYGVAFHFWRGGGAGRLLLYLTLSWLGFFIGQAIATWTGLSFIDIGPLHVGPATVGSLLFLLGGYWLSLVPSQEMAKK
jgi:hypothetical protein